MLTTIENSTMLTNKQAKAEAAALKKAEKEAAKLLKQQEKDRKKAEKEAEKAKPPNIIEFRGMQKFINGETARLAWAKPIIPECCSVEQLNTACGGVFNLAAKIVLDSSKVNTNITVSFPNTTLEMSWKEAGEYIYLIVKDGQIMKIGGTRTSMCERWGSYKCGHCVKERNNKKGEAYPGKMSVTNAHLYHTIEKDLLENNGIWEFYCWKLPVITLQVNILGLPTTVVAQTYHAYESRCIEKFRDLTGHIPQLCDNADPSYRTSQQSNKTGGGDSVVAAMPFAEHDTSSS